MKASDHSEEEQTVDEKLRTEKTAPVLKKNKGLRSKVVRRLFIASGAIVVCLVLFVVGITVGYFLLDKPSSESTSASSAISSSPKETMWTCSMHPQIKLPKAGKCPICFMDLIPLANDDSDEGNPRQLKMSPRAMKLAEIQTEPVRQQYATNEVRLVGKVDYDETKVTNITAWTSGRLDRLFVDFTGVSVRKGDHLVSMYSPDLVVAQRELIQAWNAYNRPGPTSQELTKSLLKSAEEKLRLLGVLPEQIKEIKRRGIPQDQLTIYSPIGGIVIEKLAKEGMYVQTGTKIYTIADFSQVWVYLDAYESDVPWLRYGQEVEFTTQSHPGETFKGRIAFIDPMLNEKTRTVRVRVNVPNPDGKLKPGMFVSSLVQSQLAADGKVFDLSLVGKWISPMHPEVVKDGPGKCDVCGMDLVPAEQLGYDIPKATPDMPLLIPVTAPLITGKRAVVYVQIPNQSQPTFEGREVTLGEQAGDDFIIRDGLKKGEMVVTNGNFKIDSALQIKARPSMMSPEEKAGEETATKKTRQTKLAVTDAFRHQLTDLYNSYFQLQAALADDKLGEAKSAMEHFQAALKKPDTKLLKGHALLAWRSVDAKLSEAMTGNWSSEEVQKIRKRFEPISNAMLKIADRFGHVGKEKYYRAFCPMAFENQGAAWLQMDKEIANPYFGHQMFRCGEIQRDFPPLSGSPQEQDHGREPRHEH